MESSNKSGNLVHDELDDDYIDLEFAESYGVDPDTETPIDPNDTLTLEDIVQKNISKNIRDMRSFFSSNEFITEKGDPNTNIIDRSCGKSYNLPEIHLEEFFTILDECRQESRSLHFCERQETGATPKTGIMIDFDRYQKSKDSQIAERHFDILTRHIAKLLRESIDFEEYTVDDKFTFRMFYIRKPAVVPAESKVKGTAQLYKDGFHILIPEIQTSKGFKKYLINELIARNSIKMSFKDIDHIESADKMLDLASSYVPVHFFGNSKPGKPAYQLTHVYEITFYADDDDIDRKLMDLTPITAGAVKLTHDAITATPINLVYELGLVHYMRLFQGRKTWLTKRHMSPRTHLDSKIQTLVEKSSRDIFSADELDKDSEDLSLVNINNPRAKFVMKLVNALDIEFASSYDKWFKVICAIAHTGITEDYKTVAREFSRRRPESWSPAEFERVWNEATSCKFNRSPVTIGSLKRWVMMKSPSAYAEIESEHYGNILRRGAYDNEGRVEHAIAADVTRAMCDGKFVSDVGINPRTGRYGYCWFEFVTPGQAMRKGEIYKWRYEEEPDNIHLFIAEHMPKVYNQVRDNIKDRKDNASNENEAKYWSTVDKNFKLYKSKLGDDTFQKKIVSQCRFKFRQRGFCDELDSYENIIGVGNGVLIVGTEPRLIRGYHEYKISKFTETNYVPYDPENPRIRVLEQAFRDIFPEEDVYRFILMHMSTALDRREAANILMLLAGGGRNGKSFIAKMVHNTMGNEYCGTGKSALLTSQIERGNEANSAQMHMVGKNWFYFDEFNRNDMLNTARVKSLVNTGWQSGRENYGNQKNYKNTCNPMAMSNWEFVIEDTDHGTWRRIYFYRNKIKFCEHPDPNNPYEKLVDHRFTDEYANDPAYLEAMLSILTHNYSILCRDYKCNLNLIPVPTIVRETERFRNSQDALNRFITQNMVRSPSAEPISMQTLASRYGEWYGRNIRPATQSVNSVQAQFENSCVSSDLRRKAADVVFLTGYRIRSSLEEPLEDGEEVLYIEAEVPVPQSELVPEIPDYSEEIDACREEEIDNFQIMEKEMPAIIVTEPEPYPAQRDPNYTVNDVCDVLVGI